MKNDDRESDSYLFFTAWNDNYCGTPKRFKHISVFGSLREEFGTHAISVSLDKPGLLTGYILPDSQSFFYTYYSIENA